MNINEHKFMCSMSSEAKKTEMSEFGAEKDILAGPCKEMGSSFPLLPNLNSSKVSAKYFKGQVREGDDRLCDQLVQSSLIG